MFLIRPKPLADESLSSWRQRSGIANGFKNYPRMAGTRGTKDPDWIRNFQELTWLSENFTLSVDQIQLLGLDYWSTKFTARRELAKPNRWILPLSSSTKWQGTGPSLCPDCISADAEPYVRIYWRFAFLTHCPTHRRLLIDHCHECGSPIWPSSIFLIAASPRFDWIRCLMCDTEYKYSPREVLCDGEKLSLWNYIYRNQSPKGFEQVTSKGEFLDAVWVISQLLLRNQTSLLWKSFPSFLAAPSISDADDPASKRVEALPIQDRDRVLKAALWLLGDWPNRFVTTCETAGVSKHHFIANRQFHPDWLNEVIANHLTLCKRGTTVTTVEHAISSLSNAGTPITKIAVRRKLGVTQSQAVDALLSQRRQATSQEFLVMCGRFERSLVEGPESRDQRATTLRDYLVFLLSVYMATDVERICLLKRTDLQDLLAPSDKEYLQKDVAKDLVKHRLVELNALYESSIRPKLLGESESTIEWFISRFGKPLEGHSVRERIAKMMRSGFPGELWKSVDVFRHVLDQNGYHGRRAIHANRHPGQGVLF